MTQGPLDRRSFIKVSSTTVAAFLVGCPEEVRIKSLPATPLRKDSGPQSAENAAQRTMKDGGSRVFSAKEKCAVTSRDITGPYWRPGIPVRSQFDLYGHKGEKLALKGVVRSTECEPIANAVIEMWHANPTEVAVSALSRTDTVDYDMGSPKFRYYGQFATDGKGAYAMTTMKPGWYLNGAAFRPSHIHVKIYVNRVERLTTQLYFQGDPFIERDPWASAAPERAIKLSSTEPHGLSGRFDFTV